MLALIYSVVIYNFDVANHTLTLKELKSLGTIYASSLLAFCSYHTINFHAGFGETLDPEIKKFALYIKNLS